MKKGKLFLILFTSFYLLCLFGTVSPLRSEIHTRSAGNINKKESTKCFDDLGCISTTKEWYDKDRRPENLDPLDRHVIKTTFVLYSLTKSNLVTSLEYEELMPTQDGIAVSKYCKGLGVRLLIHDFTSNGYTGWIKHLAETLTHKDGVQQSNIIAIDWTGGAEPPYVQAISNARVVALETVALLQILMTNFELTAAKIHLIGHGVGAHIAGYIGNEIKGTGRITGLDPSGPYFEGMSSVVKLDASDALFVEIIHTDSSSEKMSQGIPEATGHVDFYVNNGQSQPGCEVDKNKPSILDLTRDTLQEGIIYPGCSHKRAFKYYIEALSCDACEYIGYYCPSYQRFLEGLCVCCQSSNTTLGCLKISLEEPPFPQQTGITLYLKTSDRKPFCMHLYKIIIDFPETPKASQSSSGYFEMIVIPDGPGAARFTFNNDFGGKEIHPGNNMTFIAYAPSPPIDAIKEIRLKWIHNTDLCFVCHKSIYIQKVTLFRLVYTSTGKKSPPPISLCTNLCQVTEIKNDDTIVLKTCSVSNADDVSNDSSNLD